MGITIVVSGVDRAFMGLDKRTIAKGTARGLTKMGKQARTAVRKRLRGIYTIKAGAVTAAIKVKPAKPSRLVATVTASGRKISMRKYQARETARGVRVKILRRKSPTLLKGMFIEKVGSSEQVFYRPAAYAKNAHPGGGRRSRPAVQSRRGPRGQELPIYAFKGPSVPQLYGSRAQFKAIEKFVARRLDALVAHEILFEIERKALTG